MTITQKLRSVFPGVCVIIDSVVCGFRAARVYDTEIHAIKALGVQAPVLQWMNAVTMRSPLSLYDTYLIITFLQRDSKAFKREPDKVTEFVINRACKGYTADVILRFLKQMENEGAIDP